MPNDAQQIVSKLWNYCNVLRDDGLSYGDYVEQLTCLVFLKMAHEQTQPPWNKPSPIPKGCDWPSLLKRDGEVSGVDNNDVGFRHVVQGVARQQFLMDVFALVLDVRVAFFLFVLALYLVLAAWYRHALV